MQILYYTMLSLHIAGGTAALLLGLFIIAARKGTSTHRRAGRIYFWAMTAVCASAVFMSFYKNIPFLLLIAIFSYYPTYNGYRRIRDKALFRPVIMDKLVYGISTLFSIGMAVYSIAFSNIIMGVFTGLFIAGLARDLKLYTQKAKPIKTYLLSHIGNMLGSYIATVTAFVVVNYSGHISPLILWLGPTVIGSPVIAIFIARHAKKMMAPKAGAARVNTGLA